ncbi:uncharacterized protein GIQ15_04404 [Arthroderma uncinatum]|uniref:uncharacterized protein n=1 Tax=Arthroderma uncinatum TaxID=74035 RepID=UPI00144A9134|nr:uncharacterized protein GIQ15_04404 [Arthroderma uncinatum]KAF3481645.1 hypothetical protein GIQ15_04404 [Arthroderma uncinatum]
MFSLRVARVKPFEITRCLYERAPSSILRKQLDFTKYGQIFLCAQCLAAYPLSNSRNINSATAIVLNLSSTPTIALLKPDIELAYNDRPVYIPRLLIHCLAGR